jgi:hypothetical protein
MVLLETNPADLGMLKKKTHLALVDLRMVEASIYHGNSNLITNFVLSVSR